MQKFFKDIYNKGNFKDYFKRNKIFLLLSTCILVLSLLSGFYNTNYYTEITPLASSVVLSDSSLMGIGGLFFNSLYSDVLVIIMGLIVSIPSIIATAFSGVTIGYALATEPFWGAFCNIMPHGVFKLISNIFALTGAFLLTKMEIRFVTGLLGGKSFKDTLLRLKVPLKDIILSLTFIIVLLLIASIIEHSVTPILVSSLGF